MNSCSDCLLLLLCQVVHLQLMPEWINSLFNLPLSYQNISFPIFISFIKLHSERLIPVSYQVVSLPFFLLFLYSRSHFILPLSCFLVNFPFWKISVLSLPFLKPSMYSYSNNLTCRCWARLVRRLVASTARATWSRPVWLCSCTRAISTASSPTRRPTPPRRRRTLIPSSARATCRTARCGAARAARWCWPPASTAVISGKCMKTLEGHTNYVSSLEELSNSYLASGSLAILLFKYLWKP